MMRSGYQLQRLSQAKGDESKEHIGTLIHPANAHTVLARRKPRRPSGGLNPLAARER
jgi:hypothetical protein